MIPKELENRNHKLFNKLVPFEGMAETLEGECLRAITRIIYRHYNDGDYWHCSYGCETAGRAVEFLCKFCPVDLKSEFEQSKTDNEKEYQELLNQILEKILTYIESKIQYTSNSMDILKCKSRYEENRWNDED